MARGRILCAIVLLVRKDGPGSVVVDSLNALIREQTEACHEEYEGFVGQEEEDGWGDDTIVRFFW